MLALFFFFNDTATTEIYTLSLHDALPIWLEKENGNSRGALSWVLSADDVQTAARLCWALYMFWWIRNRQDRKSTRLNSSHANISYAVFCLKKKKIFIHK